MERMEIKTCFCPRSFCRFSVGSEVPRIELVSLVRVLLSSWRHHLCRSVMSPSDCFARLDHVTLLPTCLNFSPSFLVCSMHIASSFISL